MTVRKIIAPELIAEGRRLYEETNTPTREIAALMGITRGTLDNRIAEWKWTRRRYSAPAPATVPAAAAAETRPSGTPPAETAASDAGPRLAADEPPLAFAARVQRVLEAQMALIERTLNVLGPANSAEAERITRILAMISRTVQDIQASAEGQTSSDETDDDDVPGDIDEFREELARRIRSFVDAKRAGSGGVHGDGAA